MLYFQALVFVTTALAGRHRTAVGGAWIIWTLVIVFTPWLAALQLFVLACGYAASFPLEHTVDVLRGRTALSPEPASSPVRPSPVAVTIAAGVAKAGCAVIGVICLTILTFVGFVLFMLVLLGG